MKLTIDIDDTRLLDALGIVNGTNAVTRARAKLKAMLREVAQTHLVESGLVDNAIDAIVEQSRNRGITGALTRLD